MFYDIPCILTSSHIRSKASKQHYLGSTGYWSLKLCTICILLITLIKLHTVKFITRPLSSNADTLKSINISYYCTFSYPLIPMIGIPKP